ncbi:hypothetical protein [Thermoanaerobacterium sp. RBIITD]|uniref:hypothetical protein n=1 Tax=Thermoanaerobacterium sp. RBIITD TaxID=1550240 RepID=UPI000BB82022|nr:hypothetical protein [Thermoanaerobacterium sp. RBIITD]SNX54211.1 hypothetical protein SAMN05660242_1847 [Thermoanaerobacterium sp. RBIITD]
MSNNYVIVLIKPNGYLIEVGIDNQTYNKWTDSKQTNSVDFADIPEISNNLNNAIKNLGIVASDITKIL